ncbi:MAG: CotH kinase family protein [Ignavibacteriaceae bacterium]
MIKYIFAFLLLTFSLFSQNDQSWKIFDDTEVARVDVTIDPNTLIWIYNNVQSDSEHYAKFRFRNNQLDETVDSIGFRIRGNTSRYSQKKSFKISFNTFVQGREFYGMDKLNLNGEHNDPSIIRSKLCFDIFDSLGLTAARANHVRVYINNKYYGLYINVEHIDDEFLAKNYPDDTGNLWKCLYPADLRWLGSDPNTYKNLNNNGVPVYELTQNEEIGDFTKLVRLINIINNTPSGSLPDSLESFIDISDVLQYLAFNILTGGWDSYWSLANNYYLYHNPTEDRFRFIPYDYDNTFGIDWSGNNWSNADPYNWPKVNSGARPLAEKMLANDQYRDLYTHFLSFYREKVFPLANWETRINTLRDLIAPAAIEDTFRVKDWGFDVNDFYNSYGTAYSNQHVKTGLKQFFTQRYNSIVGQLGYRNANPIVYSIEYTPKNPKGTDTIFVTASAFSTVGFMEVAVNVAIEGVAGSTNYFMHSTSDPNSKNVKHKDRWSGFIPPLGEGVTAGIKIRVTDAIQRTQLYPRKDRIWLTTLSSGASDIFINEFMADNSGSFPDPAGENDDWLELYNAGDSPVLLTGKYLTDKKDNLNKWQFTQPELYLGPHQYLIVWCDEDLTQQGIHTNFKLSAGGEFIGLVAEDGGTILDSITFGPQQADISFARIPDASANWQFAPPTPGVTNNPTGTGEEEIPTAFQLSVYPNPFNPSTSIVYSLELRGEVSLKIYDVLGNEVAMLVNKEQEAGNYEVKFDASRLASGTYIIRLSYGDQTLLRKMVLLK